MKYGVIVFHSGIVPSNDFPVHVFRVAELTEYKLCNYIRMVVVFICGEPVHHGRPSRHLIIQSINFFDPIM
jgi:hypothetical protein